MTKILMVCHGNICRSTMAEFVLKDMVAKLGRSAEFEIESAATSREEIGSDTHHGTKTKLREMGIPYTRRAAVQVTPQDYNKYDYLICMDEKNLRNLSRIISGDTENKVYRLLDFTDSGGSIADPWYTGNFDETYDDVSRGCEGLLRHIDSCS